MSFRHNPLLGYWRRMCDEPTAAELVLEPAIASLGERYRHQYPFWGLKYFADFALLDRKLIIEVDGDSHDKPAQKEKDLIHELQVLELGWRTVRISNEEALAHPQSVLRTITLAESVLLDKETVKSELMARLGQLHASYPHLLADAATKAKRRRQSGLAGAAARAKARGTRSVPDPLQKSRAQAAQ